MIYLNIIYPNTFDEFGLNLLHVYFLQSCLAWNVSEPTHACLDQNNVSNVSMMSQTYDAIWHIPLLPSSRTRTPSGSTVGLLLLQRFRVSLPEYTSCLMPVLNLDLYVAVLIH